MSDGKRWLLFVVLLTIVLVFTGCNNNPARSTVWAYPEQERCYVRVNGYVGYGDTLVVSCP